MKYYISHQIYAATRKNGGFGVFYQSPTLSQLEDFNREIIKKNSTYSAPVALPNSTDLSLFPVNLAYYTIEDNGTRKTALLFSRYTGATNHTPDRQGNFLSHTIVFENYLEKICIPEILKQLPFQKSLTIEEETTFLPPLEELEYELQNSSSCIQEIVNFLISGPKYQNTLLAIIDEIIDGWLNTKGHNITINATTNDECINLIYALYSLIPAYLINKYSFTTYTYNPNKISYQICGIIPECKVMELDPEYFKIFDVEKYVEDYSPKWELTKFLKTWLLRHDIEKIGSLDQLFVDYNIDKLDERVEMPFKIEAFKDSISTKQLADLNNILLLFSPSLSIPRNKLINFIKFHNPELYLSYQIQEMKKEVKSNHSITTCINIIEGYLQTLGTELKDNQLLLFYKEFEQAISHLACPGIIAAEILTSNYNNIRAICLNDLNLKNHLFNCVETDWKEINNKEDFLREYEDILQDHNYPTINMWVEKKALDNDVKNGVLLENMEKHEKTLGNLAEKELINLFSRAIELKNEKGELSFTFLEKVTNHINKHFKEPSLFWIIFLENDTEKNNKDYRIPYSNNWSYSLIKRWLIVFLATTDIHSISKYEEIYNNFNEYECRWVLDRLTENRNEEGYNILLSILPKEKGRFFKFAFV